MTRTFSSPGLSGAYGHDGLLYDPGEALGWRSCLLSVEELLRADFDHSPRGAETLASCGTEPWEPVPPPHL